MRGKTVTMSKTVYRVTDAIVTFTVVMLAALYFSAAHREVTLAQGMAGYGLPACQTADAALPGGCRWVGPGEQGTWVNYVTGRA